MTRLKSEYDKLNTKTTKTIQDLSSELEDRVKQKDNEIKLMSERLTDVEKEKQESDNKLIILKSEVLILE